MPLLIVCMMSLGPFAQGVDVGLEVSIQPSKGAVDEPPMIETRLDAQELLSNIDGFFTENLGQNVEGRLAAEESDYRVGTRGGQLCSDSEIVLDYEPFPMIAGASPSKVFLFYSNSAGTGYNDHISISTTQVKGACFEDLNADGYIDLIVADQTGPSTIYWSDDQGTYSSSDKSDLISSSARRVAAGDLNNDGWLDLVISSEVGGNSTIFFNQEGSFQSQPDITFARQNDAFVNIEDMNDDGHNDLVFGEWDGDETRIFYGGPDGPDTTVDVTLAGGWTRVRDLDQDGYFDVFASDGSSIKVYLGSPTGPSTSPDYTLTTSNAAQNSDAGDLNGDGYIDIVCVVLDASDPNKVCIFEGASDGWSTSRIHDDIVHDRYYHTTVEDINKDGYADIIMDDKSNPQLAIFFGGTSWPTTPNITKSLSAGLYDIAIAIPKGGPINATISSEPQNLTIEPGDRTIKLSWDAPNDTGGVNLVRYNVYRGVEVDNLTKLGEVGRTITSYNDRPPRTGVVYHYAVTAINVKGESNRSATVNVTNTGRPLEPVVKISVVGCETLSIAW
ncbi:MAG: VCBS repeat-containing protein, partial [Thermoplasmata archaeon]|nr:VCBS repeat-containing protein [Thermoplasmata archaeon]